MGALGRADTPCHCFLDHGQLTPILSLPPWWVSPALDLVIVKVGLGLLSASTFKTVPYYLQTIFH